MINGAQHTPNSPRFTTRPLLRTEFLGDLFGLGRRGDDQGRLVRYGSHLKSRNGGGGRGMVFALERTGALGAPSILFF